MQILLLDDVRTVSDVIIEDSDSQAVLHSKIAPVNCQHIIRRNQKPSKADRISTSLYHKIPLFGGVYVTFSFESRESKSGCVT